jgi:DNA modification methylase
MKTLSILVADFVDIRSIAMDNIPYKRKEVIGDQTLYLGDCMEIMPHLGKFNAVVTDPPYGINQAGGFFGAGGFSKPIKRKEYQGSWDKFKPQQMAFDCILSISEKQIIWGGNYFTDNLPQQNKWLWWDKCMTMPTYSDGELAWTNLDGNSVKKIIYNNNGLQAKEKDRVHPTQKPLGVMKWCLTFIPDAVTILDPFMGSGTTLVACADMGRKGTGIELNEDYFNIACKRVEDFYRQGKLL